MKYIVMVFLIICFFGCATTPTQMDNSKLVYGDQIISLPLKSTPSLNEGAKVIIIRDAGFTGSLVKEKVFIDGIPIVELWPSQRYEIFLTEGEHIFGVIPSPNILWTHGINETTVFLKKGEISYLRIYTDAASTTCIKKSSLIK